MSVFFQKPRTGFHPDRDGVIVGHGWRGIFASTIIPGELGIPVLKNIHHVWPHEVPGADGKKELVLLVHGWNKGKYAVLRQVTAK